MYDLYHYTDSQATVDKILKDGALKPIDSLEHAEGRLEDYSRRAIAKKLPGASKQRSVIHNAQIYFKHIYDRFYKKATKKPFTTYGIYLTPLDLFTFPNALQYRFVVPCKQIILNSVLQLGGKVQPFSIPRLQKMMLKFKTMAAIEKGYNSSTLHFRRLPQVVVFVNRLEVTPNQVEQRQ